ncbi:MAG: protein translocase subunit SecF [Bacteroidetes bacterium]|nr:protein translocase subunit SecF [Bacteroidota bacterium]
MRFLPDIVGKRNWFYLLSLLILIPGIISLAVPPGLKLGVDFLGGSLWELRFEQPVTPADMMQLLAQNGLGETVVQTSGPDTLMIRAKEIESDSPQKQQLETAIRDRFGNFTELQFQSVGPAVGTEVAQRAVWAVVLAALGILLYLWYAFRNVQHAFRYGTCAVIALVHDAIVVLGVFSLAGKLFNVEVDSLFLTAVLTIIGFSVHDTIVVFDRIRENLGRYAGQPFDVIVNHSMIQTMGRSVATSLTVVFTLLALVLLGGVTTRLFTLTMLIGVISGTYSSIFNASVLLVTWERGDLESLFHRLVPARAEG